MGTQLQVATTVTLCSACHEYAWQDQHDPNDEMREGFQDVADILWSDRDDDTYFWDIRCGVCETMIPKGWVKYQAGVVFHAGECTHDWNYMADPYGDTMVCVHCGETQR